MNVSVLIPYRDDHGHREHVWEWVRARYAILFPNWEICVADDATGDGEHFNHGQAYNRAADHATGDVYVLGDADTVSNPEPLLAAVEASRATGDWFVPHTYHQLSAVETARLLAQRPSTRVLAVETDWTGVAVSVAPLIVVPAAAFQDVGGCDERYTDWGSDDGAFQMTLDTLYRPYRRWAGESFHLWHPRTNAPDSGAELTLRYRDAYGDRDAMLALRERHR